eukprot:533634-Hanusia_phi.AAC.1
MNTTIEDAQYRRTRSGLTHLQKLPGVQLHDQLEHVATAASWPGQPGCGGRAARAAHEQPDEEPAAAAAETP